jgi:hypothetical protein
MALVKLLASHGASLNPDWQPFAYVPLTWAVVYGCTPTTVKTLLQLGARLEGHAGDAGPLHLACRFVLFVVRA